MGWEPRGRGLGVGSEAGKELPDLGIHPPLGLIHLGDQGGRMGQRSREGQKGRGEASPPPGLYFSSICSQVLMPDAPLHPPPSCSS